jgi:Mg2+-importing ATPase
VLELRIGQVIPADVRILSAVSLECDKSVLTGESVPTAKAAEPVPVGAGWAIWPAVR